ncbi:MAG: 3-deoxy-7-phosphoheptulonate synthase [Oscillospiraceae bacterium]|nr:3-deoxy-7-phosphoheptulonate synthase [Oscillospiraceae bacterium]
MILRLKANSAENEIKELAERLHSLGFRTNISTGAHQTIIGLIGDTSKIDTDTLVALNPIVEDAKRISEPFKAANRKFHPESTVVDVNGVKIGEGWFHVISGPCSVESEEQIIKVAKSVKESGATLLRGGAFKPRTSPYSFQGLHGEGIRLLLEAKKETGLPIVTEIMDISTIDLFEDVDVIQVGARNMQNFEMLKELGKCKKPILLKRGLANTIEEFLMSAEYIMAGGNSNVILCERGVRTFETMTRNTLDLAAVALLKQLTHLPVVVDPSHAAGIRSLVAPLSRAALAVGADGLMIESHNDPAKALCDGAQSLDLDMFRDLMVDIRNRVAFEGKKM